MQMALKECLTHMPPNLLTPEMEEYATEVVFLKSRYIFKTREGKRQYGYCTYCGQDFPVAGWHHNSVQVCPMCRSTCQVKSTGMKRSRLLNEAYFVYYLRSAIDPNTIVAIGSEARRDYRGDYRAVKTEYVPKSLYVFQFGKGSIAFHRWAFWMWSWGAQGKELHAGQYEQARTVTTKVRCNGNINLPTFYSRQSIEVAVAGTPYRYSTWEHYDIDDMVEFFALYTRYPLAVEYLTKTGFAQFVTARLEKETTHNTLSWRAKTIFKVLRLSREELRAIRRDNVTMSPAGLHLLQRGKKDGSKLSPAEAERIARVYDNQLDRFLEVTQHGSMRRVHTYLSKQVGHTSQFHFRTHGTALIAWRDYLQDCNKLDLDITKENILFPRDLHQAHQNTITQITAQANKILNRQIMKRLAQLNKRYRFESDGLLIRPAESSSELIAEGKALNHCVGRYAEQYANGATIILVIRRVEEPDKPFYTVEIYNGRITQCYGNRNSLPDESVSAFKDAFVRTKLNPTQKQEVAN